MREIYCKLWSILKDDIVFSYAHFNTNVHVPQLCGKVHGFHDNQPSCYSSDV